MTEIVALAIGFGLVVVLPLVTILLGHQRKMAEMIHRQSGEAALAREVELLRDEVLALRAEVHRQTALADGLRERLNSLPHPPQASVESRAEGAPLGVKNE